MPLSYCCLHGFVGVSLLAVASSDSTCANDFSCNSSRSENDYNTLLSATSYLAVNRRKARIAISSSEFNSSIKKHGDESNYSSLVEDHDGANQSQNSTTNQKANRSVAKAIIFVKMIKVGGESFGSLILSHFARKHGLRTLQHKDCSEDVNPLGQATCECDRYSIGPDDLPPKPVYPNLSYSILYTHMHYDPKIMEEYFPAGAVRLVFLRHPLAVLQSVHRMAAWQAVNQPERKDSFCQTLAANGSVWRANCSFVQSGQDSIMDFLDGEANQQLLDLFPLNASTWSYAASNERHLKASAIVEKVAKLLEDDFIVGLQEDYEASLLLFEAALGWNRSDVLYNRKNILHRYSSKDPDVKNANDSWHIGTPRGQEIIDNFNHGPYYYYIMLYNRGVEVHKKQLERMVGSKSEVAAAVKLYSKQNTAFADCLKRTCKGCLFEDACTREGLEKNVEARPRCAEEAINITGADATMVLRALPMPPTTTTTEAPTTTTEGPTASKEAPTTTTKEKPTTTTEAPSTTTTTAPNGTATEPPTTTTEPPTTTTEGPTASKEAPTTTTKEKPTTTTEAATSTDPDPEFANKL